MFNILPPSHHRYGVDLREGCPAAGRAGHGGELRLLPEGTQMGSGGGHPWFFQGNAGKTWDVSGMFFEFEGLSGMRDSTYKYDII